MKPLVALDLDDVLYPFMDGIVPRLNAAFGVELTREDFFTFDFGAVIGAERQDVIDVVLEYFHDLGHDHPDPQEGAAEAIERLGESFRLSIVTSREDSLHELTMSWLSAHFPERFESVYLCNSYVVEDRATKRSKASVCSDIGAVALVDDNLGNAVEASRSGMRGVVFGDFPWNRSDTLPEGVVRAVDWNAVVEELVGATWV